MLARPLTLFSQEATKLVVHVLSKTMDSSLSTDKVELATLTRDATSGKVVYRIFEPEDLTPLLDAANAEKETAQQAAS